MGKTETQDPRQSLAAYIGGQSLSFVGFVFTGHYLTDTVTFTGGTNYRNATMVVRDIII